MGVFGQGLLHGVAAGAAGAVAMTLSEKVEQQVTGRPNSYVRRGRWSG